MPLSHAVPAFFLLEGLTLVTIIGAAILLCVFGCMLYVDKTQDKQQKP